MKAIKILSFAALALGLTGCFDLDREPESSLSTAKPFTSTGEMSSYLDQFYQSALRNQDFAAGGGTGIAGYDTYSDNMAQSAVMTRLNGTQSIASAGNLSNYTYIRNVNFLLTNLDNTSVKGTPEYNRCVGEARYFRAWYYYRMFIDYGQLAWASEPLAPDTLLMNLPRLDRHVIADSILADLDMAVALLPERSNSASMRVHRDVARALKSEVALFEGTWEKYHRAENDAFYDRNIDEAKIKDYFNQAVEAAQQVVDRNVWRIYNTGNVNNDYRVIFQTTDLSTNPEILWFKKYDGDEIGNNVNRYLNQGGGSCGVTASLVDDYLTIDGRPFVGEERLEAKKVWGNELMPDVRDPRLAQTVATPGQVMRPDTPNGVLLPPLIGTSAYNNNLTGYSLLKHVQIDYTGSLDAEFKGATPAIQFRYADILLNLAEALAELDGEGNASRIIDVLHPLRERAGMPDMDFDREYNTDPSYPFATLNKYVQAVRRERRIEKACEGRRLEDIMRWAAADELIVGKRPMGALFTGSNLENEAAFATLVYDQPSGNTLFLTGNPGDPYRYILPNNPTGYENGWGFRTDRDYLLPLRQGLINMTGWQNNPGW